jgi:hypothetical protein
MQDIAGDPDDGLDQGLPLGSSQRTGGAEYLSGPGFMPAAADSDLGVVAGGQS